jgi:hypothetical protein
MFPIQCLKIETFDEDSVSSPGSELASLPPKAPDGNGKLLFSMMYNNLN